MYTRCPSCRSEISFDPPANMESLPEDYKHRIKCPSCGVTIGVHLNKPIIEPKPEPAPEPVEAPIIEEPAPVVEEAVVVEAAKKTKKPGTARNILMMIISLLFIGLSVVGYLVSKEIIKLPEEIAYGWGAYFTEFDGIIVWETIFTDTALISEICKDAVLGFYTLLPLILFSLACINFIVALISAIGKKYGRAYNVVISIIMFAITAVILFYPYVAYFMGALIIDYVKAIIDIEAYIPIAAAALGFIQLVLALIFIKSLGKKEPKLEKAAA